jgi:hypothetical protein
LRNVRTKSPAAEAEPAATRRSDCVPGAVLERGSEIDAGRTERGNKPEKDTGEDGDGAGEKEHAPVDGYEERERLRHGARNHRRNQAHTGVGDIAAEGAPEQGKKDAFGKQLPGDAPAARAQRETHSHFAPASG